MGKGAAVSTAANNTSPSHIYTQHRYKPAELVLRTLLFGKIGAAPDNDAAAEGAKALVVAIAQDTAVQLRTFVAADGVRVLETELLGNAKKPVARFGGLKVVEELAATVGPS